MPNTPKGLPYPNPTDPVSSGAANFQALANAVDPLLVPFPGAQKIQAITLASASQVDFQNIPQTYTALRLVLSLRSTVAGNFDTPQMQLNANAGAAYFTHALSMLDNGTATVFAQTTAATYAALGACSGNSAAAGYCGAMIVEFPDYRGALGSLQRAWTYTSYSLAQAGAGGQLIRNGGGVWAAASAAVSRITLAAGAGANFAAGSGAVLYGFA